jgi:hypothetical protein
LDAHRQRLFKDLGGIAVSRKLVEGHLPKDLTAERHCLAAKLLDPELQNGTFPPAVDFLDPQHAALARCIEVAEERGLEVSAETIHVVATEMGQLYKFGGDDFLVTLMDELPHGVHGKHYAREVRDKAIRRRLIRTLLEAAQVVADESVETSIAIEHIEGLVADERNRGTSGRLERFTVQNLRTQYPHLHPFVIEGLLRRQETANVVSLSKVGKSWLTYSMALCIATGRPWLNIFPTTKGRVLIVDNELHPATLAYRIPAVAEALSIPEAEYDGQIEVWPVRGKGMSVLDLEPQLRKTRTEFQVIILDAKYRFIVPGTSEIDNAAETAFYNTIDKLADATEAAFIMTHHSSKGNQAEKNVTDVGSGAGAQSRAADCHIVFREHKDSECVVLDAAVRSFTPVKPLVLRWGFPLWVPDNSLDPADLKGRKSAAEEKSEDRQLKTDNAILDYCHTWRSRAEMKRHFGWSDSRRDSGIRRLVDARLLESTEEKRRGNKCEVFRKLIHASSPASGT